MMYCIIKVKIIYKIFIIIFIIEKLLKRVLLKKYHCHGRLYYTEYFPNRYHPSSISFLPFARTVTSFVNCVKKYSQIVPFTFLLYFENF